MEFDAGAVVLHDDANDLMRLHVFETSILLEYQPQTGQGGPVDASPEGIVWRTQEPGCSIPLIVHDDFLGVLEVASRKENAFSEADAELLTHVADQIAIAVQNALNFENANKARERTQTLLDLNNAITTNLDLHDLVRATSACLRGYFRHDFAGLALYDEDSEQLMIHSLDLSQPEKYLRENSYFPIEGTLNGLAFTSHKPIIRNQIDPDESSWPLARQFFDEQGLKSACFMPLISAGRAVGVLNVSSKQEGAFSEDDVELLTHIAGQIAIAAQNSLNFERARKAKERTQILLDANNAIATNLNLSDLL